MESSPNSLTVRGLRQYDWETLWTLLNTPAVITNSTWLPYSSEDTVREQLASGGHTHILVAESSQPSGRKRVAGALWLFAQRRPRTRHSGRIELLVTPDNDAQQTASDLLVAALDLADNWLGLHRVEAAVFAGDEAGRAHFEHHGFALEATMRAYAWRAGQPVDALLLARPHPAPPAQEDQA